MSTVQQSFASTEDKIHEVLEQASRHEFDHVLGLSSGGTDSLFALEAYHRFHDEHDLPAIDAVAHTNTGATFPATTETVIEFCNERGLPFLELRQKNPDRMLAPRVLENGFPSERTHGYEFINRKQDTWDALYSGFPDRLLYISGGRVAESNRRAANLGDGAVDVGQTGDRQPRLSWVAPVHGVLDGEKERKIDEWSIPITPAYDWFGFSGDCLACSFDDPTILNEIRLACPELAYALSTLVVWVYQRIRRGDLDQPLERAVWGTAALEEEHQETTLDERQYRFGGCSSCTKSCYTDGGRAGTAEKSAGTEHNEES